MKNKQEITVLAGRDAINRVSTGGLTVGSAPAFNDMNGRTKTHESPPIFNFQLSIINFQLKQIAVITIVALAGMFIVNGCGGGKSGSGELTEAKAIEMVTALPEIKKAGNLSVMSGGREETDDGNAYYSIQAGENMESHFVTKYHFRVYAKPKVEIRYFDVMEYEEMSLDEWRKTIVN
ncbi:MAG: hypothetical protein LBC47_06565 [Tannerella sp.]|jgi:hypothetical protein|nr:hypothetical protein [Tannerella sp.]